MPYFERDGLRFHYRTSGDGSPLFLQHGLGGDLEQVFALLSTLPGTRLIAFDARGHGETRPLGAEANLSFAAFADDLVAVLDHLAVDGAVVGGISMGAGVALNVALRYPARVRALILVRPAWLDGPMPEQTRQVFATIAGLIRRHGAREGRARFLQSADYRRVLRESPPVAASFLGQFDRPRAEETVAILERLPADAPTWDLRDVTAIAAPTLVLSNRQDPVHPFAYGEALAHAIPRAQFAEITPKATSEVRHAADVQRAVSEFLITLHHCSSSHSQNSSCV